MEEEHWSHRDFTQIKPRRPEGTSEFEEWESKPFSFIWPLGVNAHNGSLEDSHLDGEMVHGKMCDDQEFEFNSVSGAVVERVYPSGISPADELFFKGQLLPLHLPPRIQMVKKLSLEKQQQEGERIPNDNANAASSPLKISRLFQPKYSKFCINSTDVSLSNSLHPRSSGPGSWWDPRDSSSSSTDRDSSGDSSSSRDSNGSSQDCFDSSKEFQPACGIVDSKGFLHNREVFSTHSAQPDRSNISTWLRPPFKWKVLFGAKKTGMKPSASPGDDKLQALSQVPEYFSGSPASERYFSDCSGELTYSGDLAVGARAFERASFAQGEKDKDHSGMAKAKEYLNKYMKVLKPLAVKKETRGDGVALDLAAGRTSSFNTPAMTTRIPSTSLTFDKRPARAITNSRSFPAFSQSSRFSPKDVSPRKSAATPRNNGRPVSTSSVSELHSAIQGAIAHCKESQSKQDADSR